MKNRSNSLRVAASCAASLLFVPAALHADDYALAAGASETFADGAVHIYDSISVAGDLAISGNTKVSTTNAITLTGGTVSVDGLRSSFGGRANGANSIKAVMTLQPDADGKYTKLSATNGDYGSFSVTGVGADCSNISAKSLTLAAETAATLEQYPNGMIDFLDLNKAGANFYEVVNNTSLTGLVTIAGKSLFGRGNNYAYGAGFFKSGTFRVEVASGAEYLFNAAKQLGSFNQADCNVLVTGPGNLTFLHSFSPASTAIANGKMNFRKGAVLDVTGTTTFGCANVGANFGWYRFCDSNVFGPNIGTVKTATVNYYGTMITTPVLLEAMEGVAVTVHDVEVKRDGDGIVGDGMFRIDASAAARTFEANIPATYTNLVNNITIAKFGANAATVIVTNIPTLKVEEGVVRLTHDCVISHLEGAAGATLVADGCTVTLADGCDSTLGGLSLESANGGEFVKSGSGTVILRTPGALGGTLHVAEGELTFSAYGLTQKYFRWTFTKVVQSPNPVWLGRLWLFDVDGGHAASNLTYKSSGALTAGSVRWVCDPSTNVAHVAGAVSYQQSWNLNRVFSHSLTQNMNNFPRLASPVIDPENEASWLGVEMRLADTDKAVTGYNVMAYEAGQTSTPFTPIHGPVSWKVEASYDGADWTEIESVNDFNVAGLSAWGWANGVFYNNESYTSANNQRGAPVELFKFHGYRSSGLAANDTKAVTLQVDSGATANLTAFTVAPQKIGGIIVDYATSGGTIQGGTIAPGGKLTIRNGAGHFVFGTPLPGTLTGVTNAGNFESWSVFIDGDETAGRIRLDNNGHLVVVAYGTVLFFR